jgi:hypothetical protein
VHAELARNQSERRGLLVPCRGQGYRLIGHLVDHAPSGNGPVEVVMTVVLWPELGADGASFHRATM